MKKTILVLAAVIASCSSESGDTGADSTSTAIDDAVGDAGSVDDDVASQPGCEALATCGVIRESTAIGRGGVVASGLSDVAVALGLGGVEFYGLEGGPLLGAWALPHQRVGRAMAVDGTTVLVVSLWDGDAAEGPEGEDELHEAVAHVLDISDPTAPVEVGTVELKLGEWGWPVVILEENRAVVKVANNSPQLFILDLSDRSAPRLARVLSHPQGMTVTGMALEAGVLYTVGETRANPGPVESNPEPIDPDDPGPPPVEDPEPTPDPASKPGTFVGYHGARLTTWDLSNPDAPMEVATVTTAPEPFKEMSIEASVGVDGDTVVWVWSGRRVEGGDRVRGLSTLSGPTLIPQGDVAHENHHPDYVLVADDTGWLFRGGEIDAYSVGGGEPEHLFNKAVDFPGSVSKVSMASAKLVGGRLGVVHSDTLYLLTPMLDGVEEEGFPVERSTEGVEGPLTWAGDLLVVNEKDTLRVFDACGLQADESVAEISDVESGSLIPIASGLLLAPRGSGATIIKLSDPSTPVQIPLPDTIDAAVATESAVFGVSTDALMVFDFDGQQLGQAAVPMSPADGTSIAPAVAASADAVLVAPFFGTTNDDSLPKFFIFDVTEPSAPTLTDTIEHDGIYLPWLYLDGDHVLMPMDGGIARGPLSALAEYASWDAVTALAGVDHLTPTGNGWVGVRGSQPYETPEVVRWTGAGMPEIVAELQPRGSGGNVTSIAWDGARIAASRGQWGIEVVATVCD
ncbi:MAG: hypothetical protein ACI9OJ_002277 [Myxococcota bacterium]|jgi:hypothetical protein